MFARMLLGTRGTRSRSESSRPLLESQVATCNACSTTRMRRHYGALSTVAVGVPLAIIDVAACQDNISNSNPTSLAMRTDSTESLPQEIAVSRLALSRMSFPAFLAIRGKYQAP